MWVVLKVYKCFSLRLFCVLWDYSNSKHNAKHHKMKAWPSNWSNTNQNTRFSWLAWSGFDQPGSGDPLIDLAKSIHAFFGLLSLFQQFGLRCPTPPLKSFMFQPLFIKKEKKIPQLFLRSLTRSPKGCTFPQRRSSTIEREYRFLLSMAMKIRVFFFFLVLFLFFSMSSIPNNHSINTDSQLRRSVAGARLFLRVSVSSIKQKTEN